MKQAASKSLEDSGYILLRNVIWLVTGPHGVISQKMELFRTTAVRISNPMKYICHFSLFYL
jgi:hypothetical protein